MNDLATKYAELLAELTKYKGGEFVPKDGRKDKLVFRRGGFYWGRGEDYCQAKDARAHIELTAWHAVREWCDEQQAAMVITHSGVRTFITIEKTKEQWWNNEPIGFGDDDATALLSALRTINGATK